MDDDSARESKQHNLIRMRQKVTQAAISYLGGIDNLKDILSRARRDGQIAAVRGGDLGLALSDVIKARMRAPQIRVFEKDGSAPEPQEYCISLEEVELEVRRSDARSRGRS